MIHIDQLKKSDIGRWVIYHAGYLKANGEEFTEKGKIKSWNDKWIFVVYKCANEWDKFKNYTAAATNPKELTFF